MRASSIAMAVAALALAPRIAVADPAPVASPAATPPVAPPAPAAAPPVAPIDTTPRFELLDRGDAVEVIAHHVKAARTAVLPVRSRLEIPISGAPQARRVMPGDPTVKLIEIDSQDATRVLSVKLGFERADVKALSRFAQAIQVGDDLHLLIPRKLPDGDIAPRLPEPTLPRAVSARIEPPAAATTAPAPAAAPTAPPAAAIAQATPATTIAPTAPAAPVLGPRPDPHAASPAPIAPPAVPPSRLADRPAAPAAATAPVPGRPRSAADALSAAGPAPATATPPAAPTARSLSQTLAAERDDAWSKISMYGALGLGAAGAGLWLLRRRKARPGTTASIEILAQRSLGGKARIVWLSAGQRELIVSVTAQQVRMLGQWRKTDPAEAHPSYGHAAAEAYSDSDPPAFAPPVAPNDKPVSPAVSGLLRLRRTSQMAAVMPDEQPRAEARGTQPAFARAASIADPLGDPLGDDLTDTPADELWAKEILAATRATGARR